MIRRTLIELAACVVVIMAAPGCKKSGDSTAGENKAGETGKAGSGDMAKAGSGSDMASAGSGETAKPKGVDLEVTHWWTSGGEAAAVKELAKAFDATGNHWIDGAI